MSNRFLIYTFIILTLVIFSYSEENKKNNLKVDLLVIPETIYSYEPIEILIDFTLPLINKLSYSTKKSPLAPYGIIPYIKASSPDGYDRYFEGFIYNIQTSHTTICFTFLVRFMLNQPGTWKIETGYILSNIWYSVTTDSIQCIKGDSKGIIKRDSYDKKFFSFSQTQDFFYPVGMNVAWAKNYDKYLKKIHKNGGNLIRVWICSWNFPLLEDSTKFINLDNARKLDELFYKAHELGINILLVLLQHYWFIGEWEKNPFNISNGGPCRTPVDFWTNPSAIEDIENYINYIVIRYGAFPNLFGFEIFNEADLIPRDDDISVIQWHRRISSSMRKKDPYGHLITTSLLHPAINMIQLFSIDSIDFVTSHIYTTNILEKLILNYTVYSRFNKPYFVAEAGLSDNPNFVIKDKKGIWLYNTVWLNTILPSAGGILPWWWDNFIDPNDLYHFIKGVTEFTKNEDRRGKKCYILSMRLPLASSSTCIAGSILNDAIYGFIYNSLHITTINDDSYVVKSPCMVTFEGLNEGIYEVEYWDIYSGKQIKKISTECKDKKFVLYLPNSKVPFAFKAKFIHD